MRSNKLVTNLENYTITKTIKEMEKSEIKRIHHGFILFRHVVDGLQLRQVAETIEAVSVIMEKTLFFFIAHER